MTRVRNFLDWLVYMTSPPSPEGREAALYINGVKLSGEGEEEPIRKVSRAR